MKTIRFMLVAMLFTSGMAAFSQSSPDTLSSQEDRQGKGHGQEQGHAMSPDAQLARMARVLNLTDDQKAKIKPILEDQSIQMQQLMRDSSSSEQDKRSKFQELHQNTMTQIRPILNADQQKKLEAMHGREGHRGGQGADHDQDSKPQ